ncbi:hypothetical protein tb265_22000 [Gemmatimonadetes bacterium T265]|nr:hypothetical protein tb265_22000 [Gemmatimonadetes bacterium T265]
MSIGSTRAAVGAAALLAGAAAGPPPHATLPAPDDPRAAGVYRLERVNGRALPAADRLVGAAGYELVGRVDRVLLNLHPSGRFTVDVHYQYAHVVAGTPVPLGDDWSDADAGGAWTVRDGRVTLLPDPSRRGRPSPALSGDWRRDRIVMDLRYAGRYTAGQERQYVVRLQRAAGVF